MAGEPDGTDCQDPDSGEHSFRVVDCHAPSVRVPAGWHCAEVHRQRSDHLSEWETDCSRYLHAPDHRLSRDSGRHDARPAPARNCEKRRLDERTVARRAPRVASVVGGGRRRRPRGQSRRTTLSSELLIFSPPLYSMNPSLRNLFMKKFTRERVVPDHLGERLLRHPRQRPV